MLRVSTSAIALSAIAAGAFAQTATTANINVDVVSVNGNPVDSSETAIEIQDGDVVEWMIEIFGAVHSTGSATSNITQVTGEALPQGAAGGSITTAPAGTAESDPWFNGLGTDFGAGAISGLGFFFDVGTNVFGAPIGVGGDLDLSTWTTEVTGVDGDDLFYDFTEATTVQVASSVTAFAPTDFADNFADPNGMTTFGGLTITSDTVTIIPAPGAAALAGFAGLAATRRRR